MKVKYGVSGTTASTNMADLIAFHSYSHHSFLSPPRMIRHSSNHKRSHSGGNRSASPDKTVTKAKSTNDLSGVAAERPALRSSPSSFEGVLSESDFSTLKDPRLASSSNHDLSRSSSAPPQHPDLSNEVTALSVKLIQAINNQTTLDDTLVATRQALEKAQNRIQTLESENEKYRRDIDNEVLVKKADTDKEILRLKTALAQEKAQRALAEQGKKNIEQELESLTAALFEEANKMVAAAKIEREAVEKKNEQLRSQIKDTELLLASHQEQLAELKAVMQGMSPVKDEPDTHTVVSPVPVSPSGASQVAFKNTFETENNHVVMPDSEEICPGPSTSFPHLIKTVCRTDLQAYNDFRDLLVQSRSSKPPSRATSVSYSGLNVMSLAGLAGHGSGGIGSGSSSPAKSQPAHSPNGSVSSPPPAGSHIPLKETRFYKRVLMEDIEPTLRLDASPGISWLARRTVMSSICDGSLVVEPMPSVSKKWAFPCSLCGERRDGIDNERTHRFRTSDSESAQRYPLCVLCVEKVRSCCEFTGYLRLILDGHVHVDDVEEEKDAWEETIRLRERMFWSRVGAGVIPIFSQANNAEAVLPATDDASQNRDSAESNRRNDDQPRSGQETTQVQPENGKLAVTEDPSVSPDSQIPVSGDLPTLVEKTETQDSDRANSDTSEDSTESSTSSTSSDISEKGEMNTDTTVSTEDIVLSQPATCADEKSSTETENRELRSVH